MGWRSERLRPAPRRPPRHVASSAGAAMRRKRGPVATRRGAGCLPSCAQPRNSRIDVCHRPDPLSIAGDDPHARLNLLQPATPNLRRSRARWRVAYRQTRDRAEPARLSGPRFGGMGTPPDLRYTAWQAVAPVSPPRGADGVAHQMVEAPPRHWLINGSGCAAASIGGDRMGDSSMGNHVHTGSLCAAFAVDADGPEPERWLPVRGAAPSTGCAAKRRR